MWELTITTRTEKKEVRKERETEIGSTTYDHKYSMLYIVMVTLIQLC